MNTQETESERDPTQTPKSLALQLSGLKFKKKFNILYRSLDAHELVYVLTILVGILGAGITLGKYFNEWIAGTARAESAAEVARKDLEIAELKQQHESSIKHLPDETVQLVDKITGLNGGFSCDSAVVERVWLGGSQVTDDDLAEMAVSMRLIVELDLQSTGISDDGLKAISGLVQIRELTLNETARITDDGMKYLSDMESLQILRLENTGIGNDGLVHLGRLRGLKELYLANTHVTTEGIEELQKALPGCKVETSL